MKKISFLVLLSVSVLSVSAQLQDTKWRNTMYIPDAVVIIFDFKKDTVSIHIAANGSLVETMTYTVSKDTLRLTKVSGTSPCSGGVTGDYKIELKEEKLYISPINDPCSDRSNAFISTPWIKEK